MVDEEMVFTLNQMLTNPTGKSSAQFASRERIRADLESRFEKLLKDNKKFIFKIYKVKNVYYFHFLIPSEKFGNDLKYDVVLRFSPDNKDMEKDRTISRYSLKMFSNSPAFMFTYTYVFNNQELLPKILKKKCSKTALKEPPKIKNPLESLGFEKSCYFAGLYIREARLTNKFELDKNLYIFNKEDFLTQIIHQEKKLNEYKSMDEKMREKKKREKEKKKKKKEEQLKKSKKIKKKK
jgi:hypothetical protein